MSKIFVDQVDPKTGTSLTLGTSGDTVNIPSGVTLANAGTMTGVPAPTSGVAASAIDSGTIATARLGSGTASSSTFLRGDQTYATAGGDNTPYFKVALSATQNNVGTSNAKVNFNHRLIDPDSVFDISNYKFLPTTAGKYFFNVNLRLYSSNSDASMTIRLYKNGSEIDRLSEQRHSGQTYSILVGSSIQEANGSSDYFEVYVSISQNQADITADPSNYTWSYFEGFKLIT